MSLSQRIAHQFGDAQKSIAATLEALLPPLEAAVDTLFEAWSNDHKLLCAGTGVHAADANYLAAILSGRGERERLGLAAYSVNANGPAMEQTTRWDGHDEAIARAVLALGRSGDVFILFAGNPGESAAVRAIEAAREREMKIVAILARGGADSILNDEDVAIVLGIDGDFRHAELNRLISHCLCDGVDWNLLGDE